MVGRFIDSLKYRTSEVDLVLNLTIQERRSYLPRLFGSELEGMYVVFCCSARTEQRCQVHDDSRPDNFGRSVSCVGLESAAARQVYYS